MKLTKVASTLVAAVALMSGVAHADAVSVNGGTVHFEGQLVNAACAVSTQSDNQTVRLGQYRTAAVAFAGQTDATDPTLLAVNSGDNGTMARGVGIEILDVTSLASG
ncbi:Fimbriae-like adhesin SfmA [Pantoea sp. AS-PWVM4]|nr:Fimbriae-like adhesin SfmA [Pantoea sp. AS-PWVM4]